MNHLVVYKRKRDNDYIEWMLTGSKTLDIKFSFNRSAPYKKLNVGDHIYIKVSGGPVVGRCTISKTQFIDIEAAEQILNLLLSVWEPIGLKDECHARKYASKISTKKYATVFYLSDPIKLQHPVRIDKHDQRVWIVDYQLPEELKYAIYKNI